MSENGGGEQQQRMFLNPRLIYMRRSRVHRWPSFRVLSLIAHTYLLLFFVD